MDCLWEEIPGTRDQRNWRLVRCTRQGCQWSGILQAPPPNDTIHVDCTGFPNDDETDEWLNYFAATFSLSESDARQWYEEWKADGSDLSELPPPAGIAAPQRPPAPTHGPGTELKTILAQLQINPTASCGCESAAQEMNRLGVKGVEKERERFLSHLRTAYSELNPSWSDKAAIGVRALAMGLVINPADPANSLLNEAIRRASKP